MSVPSVSLFQFSLCIRIKLTLRLLEEDSYEGTQVSGSVCEREIISGKAAARYILYRAHVLNVGWILARARNPYSVQPVGVLLRLDVLLKIGRHGAGQILRVVVIFGLPSEDLTAKIVRKCF